MINKSNFLAGLLFFIIPILCFGQGAKTQEKDTIPYEVRYEKLKKLFIERIDSESYKRREKLVSDYMAKLNLTPFDDGQIEEMGMLEWTKANLKRTSFKTEVEASKEWAAVELAQDTEFEKNSTYHHYLFETLKATRKYDIPVLLREEVMEEYPEKFPKPKQYINTLPKMPGQ